MNEKIIEELTVYLVEQLAHVRGKQWMKDTSDDMFHFYGGMAMALKDVLDELCKMKGVLKELERKEEK